MRISDWSSDVCSSDLKLEPEQRPDRQHQEQRPAEHPGDRHILFLDRQRLSALPRTAGRHRRTDTAEYRPGDLDQRPDRRDRDHARSEEANIGAENRSEERRDGKEFVSTCRSRWSPDHYKKNKIYKPYKKRTI